MNYIRYHFHLEPVKPLSEILISDLAELPFESFMETDDGVDAFIPEPLEDEPSVERIVMMRAELGEIHFFKEDIPDQNWNVQWEKDYPEVRIGNKCRIRAPFHPESSDFEFDILINPQMSFGTGHHATTYLMLSAMLELAIEGKEVLDMGCGTGVLAIAAALAGAGSVRAIDIEEWAYRNTLENSGLNNVDILVQKGDIELIQEATFDLILANINKNVLLAHVLHYAKALNTGGTLLLSGFFPTDAGEILAEAGKYKFATTVSMEKDGWCALQLTKN